MEKFNKIKLKCENNLKNVKDFVRWCDDYKQGNGNFDMIMSIFSLNWNDVAFVIFNIEEIKKEVLENGLV